MSLFRRFCGWVIRGTNLEVLTTPRDFLRHVQARVFEPQYGPPAPITNQCFGSFVCSASSNHLWRMLRKSGLTFRKASPKPKRGLA
jgi:hypothetical protein